MRAVAFILATCALLPAASAGAGQCTTEIDNLAKQLAARDAGSGPTAGAAAIGQHPPTSAVSEATRSGAANGNYCAAAEVVFAAVSTKKRNGLLRRCPSHEGQWSVP